jgi:Kef-type K+ transport system membrane component KefB/predicted transcriptional regulator
MLLSIGMLYLLALGAGRLSAAIGIPRVTGYLIVGLATGPSTGHLMGLPGLITPGQLNALVPVHDIILGLIVFTIGVSFNLGAIRKIGPLLFCVSGFEMGLTAFLVGFGTYVVCAPSPLTAGFLAVIAITTAPAATQMVMREYQAEGPLSDTILPLIGINNLVAIIAFIMLQNRALSSDASFVAAIAQLLIPIGLGMVAGLVIAVMDQRLIRLVERQMLLLASMAIMTGIAVLLDVSAMLSALVSGAVAVNASPYSNRIIKDLSAIDYPLYVFFFIMAGAQLHLESLTQMGLIGGSYVVLRIIGKNIGCRVGASVARTSSIVKNWLGPAMLAQAGLAIGLVDIRAKDWPGTGKALQTVVLASVVVFEGIGPLLTRISLVNAGEVTVLNLLVQRSPVGISEGFHDILNQFRNALGILPATPMKSSKEILVGHIMRRNVEVVSNKAPFDEVLKVIGHSRYDRLPVVNDQNELIGVIKYADIANTLFDPSLGNLVVADDIATDAYLKLTPEDTLGKAMAALKDYPDDSYLLVVDKQHPKTLVGVVRHNDVLFAQMRLSK